VNKNSRISQLRQTGRTLTTSFAVVSTTINTKDTKIRGDDSVRITVSDRLVEQEIALSVSTEFELPINCVSKILAITSAHKFKIFYRAVETQDYIFFAVCDKQFLFNGALLGQFKIVGEYDIETLIKIIYA
jgi:hypothetical protein